MHVSPKEKMLHRENNINKNTEWVGVVVDDIILLRRFIFYLNFVFSFFATNFTRTFITYLN